MTHDDAGRAAELQRLIAEDAVGQLRRRDGRMARLGSEDGTFKRELKLDWVEGIARLLDDPTMLEQVEAEARELRTRGIRHVIWAGMGGSVMTLRVLCDLGFGGHSGEPGAIALYPLDSTDPVALNAVMRAIAAAKGLSLPRPIVAIERELLGVLLRDVLMIGVAMGMTSEEPITHLAWFTDLLQRAALPPAEHLLVMTFPGSFLDAFAREHQAPSRSIQLDGGMGASGRMSAPVTRVFLLPVALYLTQTASEPGQLRAVLRQAWALHDLDGAASRPAAHPFVRLAAALGTASAAGACRMLLALPDDWRALLPWVEQLMEESLGKGGKGIVVFDEQTLSETAPGAHSNGLLRVRVVPSVVAAATGEQGYVLAQPPLASGEPRARLAALAASFLGWQLVMALYGYLHDTPFAGQPAVEDYKARARALRTRYAEPLASVAGWQPAFRLGPLTLLAPTSAADATEPATAHPAAAFARVVRAALRAGGLRYLDVTVNGEAPPDVWSLLDARTRAIGNQRLGIPVKLRRAPAAYHSTEQSEMDGPPALVSLRLVARDAQPCLLGAYDNAFLHAQAVGTWQAMLDAGRPCCLLIVDGALADARESLAEFLAAVERALQAE
jgi:glucose-6-phosphate isomerase